MAQHVKVIDVTRSFVVADPNYFPENQGYTQGEDTPEKMPPILAYEGYNFMPTMYGYRSYFGTNSTLNVAALTSRVDKVLLFQLSTFQNILIALCEDGIWTTTPSIAASTWTQIVIHAVPVAPIHYNWTWCVIENVLYCYKEGTFLVHKYSFAGAWTNFTPCCFKTYATTAARTGDLTYTSSDVGKIVYDQQTASYFTILTITPTFTAGITTATRPFVLNMAGQKGIFRANGRLGFWDSANSVSWSDTSDLTDFVPSVETRAGNAIFLGVRGTIVQVLAQGDGFTIYTTKGIVGVRFTNDINLIWEANSVTDAAGIAYPCQVTTGITDLEHFAFTNTGIKKIGTFNALSKSHAFEEILTDTYDLLKESNSPVYLDFYNGRYLFLSVIDNTYIDGRVSFTYHTIDSVTVRVLENGGTWTGALTPPIYVNGMTGIVADGWKTLQNFIAGKMNSGIISGMMCQWTATGNCTVPSRTTAIKPYNFAALGYTHVPNVGLDVSSQISAPTIDALVVSGTYADEAFAALPSSLDLGYWGYQPISTTPLGVTDGSLTEFVTTQNEEWTNFTTIQGATYAALIAAPTSAPVTTTGVTPYETSPIAQAQIDIQIAADIAAHAGGVAIGNVVTWDEAAGTMLSGAGSIVGPTFSGVGTYAATMTLTKNFVGGYDIKRRFTKTYSIRNQLNISTIYARDYSIQNVQAGYFGSPGIVPFPAAQGIYQNPSFPNGTLYNYTSDAAMNAIVLGGCPATIPHVTGGFTNGAPITIGAGGSVSYLVTPGSFSNIVFGCFQYTLAPGTTQEYYIDTSTVTNLVLTANGALTGTSTATALQNTLRWAYIAQGEPLGNFTSLTGSLVIPGAGINGSSVLPYYADITIPGASFLLADGSPAPVYPTFTGAFAFDTALKKWGKLKASFKQLLEMAPVNATGPTVSYTNFGVSLSMMDAAGAIKLFDIAPADSWIRYGKIGYSRQGFTKAQEIRVHFRNSSTGNVILDSSIDGRSLESTYSIPFPFTTAASIEVGCYNVGRWHTITISGNWDLQYLEFRANSAGKR